VASCAASGRIDTSIALPGAKPWIRRTGLVGHAWADAVPAATVPAMTQPIVQASSARRWIAGPLLSTEAVRAVLDTVRGTGVIEAG
jgi:hypothetical protein